MKVYALAKIVNEVYGHGSFGKEYHICSTNFENIKFHPLFKSKEEAEIYRNKLLLKFDYKIVPLNII